MIAGARQVADAVLYEGFLLFPYSKSALKNQMPFQFGVVMPRGYADTSEPPTLSAECVLCLDERDPHDDRSAVPKITAILRFLQIADEPVEREVPVSFTLDQEHGTFSFSLDTLHGRIVISAQTADKIARIRVEVCNDATVDTGASRREALSAAFVGTHVLLEARGGAFASMLDPPAGAMAAVAASRNDRMFPVLVGEGGEGTQLAPTMMLSPIALYDFPRIAAASAGNTFDGTEIDELLMLSVASLTEEERQQAHAAHPYVRDLLDRAESLDAHTLRGLHGELTLQASRPANVVTIGGVTVGPGSRVRVQPKGRADVWDDIVRGMTARVNAVRTDVDGKQYIGVVFEADPAAGMHEWYGRSFFYGVDEVEPLP